MTVPLHLRSIFPQELPSLLATNGFELTVCYGDFGREPFTSESPRQVCLCQVATSNASAEAHELYARKSAKQMDAERAEEL
jgi:hypothetical protein